MSNSAVLAIPLFGLLLFVTPSWGASDESWRIKGKSLLCEDGKKVVRQFRLSPPSWDATERINKAFRSRVAIISDDKHSAVVFEYSYDASTVSYFANGCTSAWRKIYPQLEGARQARVLDNGAGVLFDLLTIAHYDVPDSQGIYLDEEAGDYKEGYIVFVSSDGVQRLMYGPIWSYHGNIPIVLSPNSRFGYSGSGHQYLFFDLTDGRYHFYELPPGHYGGKMTISDSGRVTITRRIGRRKADGTNIDDEMVRRAQAVGTAEYVKLIEGSTEVFETSHEHQF